MVWSFGGLRFKGWKFGSLAFGFPVWILCGEVLGLFGVYQFGVPVCRF